MLVMAILLALCVGAVSAADTADMANGGIADIAVSPVSEDVSVLADDGDENGNEVENTEVPVSSDENDNITIEVNETSIFVPENKNITFDVNVLNDSQSIDYTKEDIELGVYSDKKDYVNITDFILNAKSISFIIPDTITNPSSLSIFYKPDVYDVNATIELKRTIYPTIEVPSSVYVDFDNKTGNFNIKILDINESMNFTSNDLSLNYYPDGSDCFYLIFTDNETFFNEGSNITEVRDDGKTYIKVGEGETAKYYVIANSYNKTIDGNNVTFYLPAAYIIKNGVIFFRVNDTVNATLNVMYSNKTVTPIEDAKDITLKIINGNKIDVPATSQLDNNTKVEFKINVTDKNGKLINITKEDFILTIIYCGDNNLTSEELTIDNFNFTIVNNVGTISFYVKNIGGNYNYAKLNIAFRNNTVDEAITTKNIAFYEITVLTNKSKTEYMNNYIIVKLWNNYLNKAVNGTLYYQLVNSSMGVRWGFNTDKNGQCNQSLDYIYSLGQGYIPVAKGYTLIITYDGVCIGKNCTINITKAKSTFSVNNYTSTYASGKKFVIKLLNSDKKAVKNVKISLRVYFSSKSYQDLTLYTNGSGQGSVGINLGKGKYKVIISVGDSNFLTNKITRYITVVAIKNAKISAKKTTAYYNYGSKFKVKMTNSKGVALKGAAVLLNVYTGKKYKVVRINTDDKGYAYWTVSGISIGKHRVLIGSGSNGATSNVVQTYITVKKGKTIVTAPKVTNKYKTSAYFKITLKTYGTKKILKGVYLTVKVYTGKKYKTYKVKTNKKGVASLNTQALSKGTHKVVITSTNKYYTISKSGKLIVIK